MPNLRLFNILITTVLILRPPMETNLLLRKKGIKNGRWPLGFPAMPETLVDTQHPYHTVLLDLIGGFEGISTSTFFFFHKMLMFDPLSAFSLPKTGRSHYHGIWYRQLDSQMC